MAASTMRGKTVEEFPEREQRLDILDQDLAIMEHHATELENMESEIQEEMRKWDREYKDERLHSIPRPRKHLR